MNRVRVASVGVNFNNLVRCNGANNWVSGVDDHRNIFRQAFEHLQQNCSVIVFVYLLNIVHDQQFDGLVISGR